MGNVIAFGNESERTLDRLIQAYRESLKVHGPPRVLYEVNEDRIEDLDDAVALIESVTEDESFSVFAGYDDDDCSIGYISIEGDYWWMPNDETLDSIHAAEDLSDGVELDATPDGRFRYTLTFRGIMKPKRKLN